MNFRSLFFSLFLVVAFSFALVQAEDAKKEPRGPKITNKVAIYPGPNLSPKA